MAVPEAAVHKDDALVFRQHDVRSAGESAVVGGVDGEAVAGAVQQAAELDFGLGVPALDPSHVPGALLLCQGVCHEHDCKSMGVILPVLFRLSRRLSVLLAHYFC